jgi:valacyclovir hydrolase
VLKFDKFSILGWSDGGITGLILAALFPNSVQKLVVWGGNAYVTQKDLDIYKGELILVTLYALGRASNQHF